VSSPKRGPRLDIRDGRVELAHGAGGREGVRLVEEIFHANFGNEWLSRKDDQASVRGGERMVVTTDSFVVTPLFFPGGDIGSLAVHGAINDVAMAGAEPAYLTAAFILEEGFPLADLRRIAASMGEAARAARTPIVAGDTKVVERGKGDGVFISMTGVGFLAKDLGLSADRARPGDAVLLSGSIGDHGVAIMSRRENLEFATALASDSAPLHGLVRQMTAAAGEHLRVMRDPTRGGLAATLNEIAQQSKVGFLIDEARIPVKPPVAAACEFLGLDPLNVANEGKLVAIAAPEGAETLLRAMRAHPLGRDAAIIGQAIEDEDLFVQMRTLIGGRRIVDWLAGEQLPRIC